MLRPLIVAILVSKWTDSLSLYQAIDLDSAEPEPLPEWAGDPDPIRLAESSSPATPLDDQTSFVSSSLQSSPHSGFASSHEEHGGRTRLPIVQDDEVAIDQSPADDSSDQDGVLERDYALDQETTHQDVITISSDTLDTERDEESEISRDNTNEEFDDDQNVAPVVRSNRLSHNSDDNEPVSPSAAEGESETEPEGEHLAAGINNVNNIGGELPAPVCYGTQHVGRATVRWYESAVDMYAGRCLRCGALVWIPRVPLRHIYPDDVGCFCIACPVLTNDRGRLDG